jgi:exonuclease III
MNQTEILVLKSSFSQTKTQLKAPQCQRTNFIKHILQVLKAHTDNNTVVLGDSNILLSVIDRSYKQKTNKEILELNDTINHMNLTDICRIFHQTTTKYTYFASLSKYKKIEITPWILSNHNVIKLELNKTIAEDMQIRSRITHCSRIIGS